MWATIFIIFLSPVYSLISFDPAQSQYCLLDNGGCNFANSSIWIGGITPAADDIVDITPSYSSRVMLYIQDTVEISSLSIIDSTLILRPSSNLVVCAYIYLGSSANITILFTSQLVDVISSSLNLTISPSSVLNNEGTMLW